MTNLANAAWSGAFISWVMKKAAEELQNTRFAGLDFPYNSFHTVYAQTIRDNPTKYPAFELLDPNPLGVPREWEPGDIVVKTRLANNLTFSSPRWSGFGHADIVLEDRLGAGGVVVGGNLTDRVRSIPVTSTIDYFVIIRAKLPRHRQVIKNVARRELLLWEQNKWQNSIQEGARQRVNEYKAVVNLPPTPDPSIVTVTAASPIQAPISPYIELLESFHPKIQYELTRRRSAAETANVYMPFVKLTSLSTVLSDNLPDGQSTAYCPSLGIHGKDNSSFEEIYLPKDNRSIIGYAVAEDGAKIVPVVVSGSAQQTDPQNIPIPGITQVSVERGTAGPMGVRGGLLKADLKIVAYSVGQVDALLRYFLRPATRVVLELGRMSSNRNENQIKPYDWRKNKTDIQNYFNELIRSPERQKDFIETYIYNNYGNYEAFIAYVVKFNLKYNKNNTFEIDLILHSVQQVEVPTKHTGVQATCPSPSANCKTMDIQEYFSDAYSWKDNSFQKLMEFYTRTDLTGEDLKWANNVVPIKNNQTTSIGAGSTQGGTRDNEYFVTWRFFVEKILNDRTLGIASMLGNSSTVDAISDLALLRPVSEPPIASVDKGLIANQVGYHPNLRSVNPGVMIIYNQIAQNEFEDSSDRAIYESVRRVAGSGSRQIQESLRSETVLDRITVSSEIGTFTNLLENRPATEAGASFLSRGVWLNTKAIKQAFTSTDTISSAISMLLNMMNSATEGYWNLQLYSTDINNPGMHVIDMGLSKEPKLVSGTELSIDKEEAETSNILDSVSKINETRYRSLANPNEPKYIYMFNRGTKRFNDGDLGSDLIDLNVEFNMPQVIAVQAIANIGGPAQKSTLQSINIKELQEITLIKDLFTPCNNSSTICSDTETCQSDEIQKLQDASARARRELENARLRYDPAEELARSEVGQYGYSPTSIGLDRALESSILANDRLAEAEVSLFNPNLVGTIREYADLGTALQLIEINPSRMMKQLNLDSTNVTVCDQVAPSKVHAFNSSNLTKTVVDVTLPGIGGIGLFQSFLVDRVPSILDRGFYVVTKIVHEFTSQNGWITKIQGRFRFRPAPESQRSVSTTQTTRPLNQPTQPQAIQPTIQPVPSIQAPTFFPQLPSTRPEQMEVFGDTALTRSIPLRNP